MTLIFGILTPPLVAGLLVLFWSHRDAKRRFNVAWEEAHVEDAQRTAEKASHARHARAREVIARHAERFGWNEQRQEYEHRHLMKRWKD